METTEMTRSDSAAGGASASTTRATRDELAHDASRLTETAKKRARQEAETRKGQATQAAKCASSALDKAAEELKQDENAPAWLASAFKQTADGIQRFAGDVDQRSAEQIGRDVSRFARQNPSAFLAASAAAGFAAARFLRAGAEYQHDHQGDAESYSSGNMSSPTESANAGFSPAGQSRFSGAEGGTVL